MQVERESQIAVTEAEGRAVDAEARTTLAETETAAVRYRNVLAEARTTRARKTSTVARRRAARAAAGLAAAQLAVSDAEGRTAAAAAIAVEATAACASAAAATASCAAAAAAATSTAKAAAAAAVAELPSTVSTAGKATSMILRPVQAVARKEGDEEEKGQEGEEEKREKVKYSEQVAWTRRQRAVVAPQLAEVVRGEAERQEEKRDVRDCVNPAEERYTDKGGRREESTSDSEQRPFVGRTHLLSDASIVSNLDENGAAQGSSALGEDVRRSTTGEENEAWQSLNETIAQLTYRTIG